MPESMDPPQDTGYRSPRHKLLKFFEQSRNQWKAKCLEAKAALRQVKNRANWLAHSRDTWKLRARDLKDRVRELEAESQRQQAEIAALKKSHSPPPLPQKPS